MAVGSIPTVGVNKFFCGTPSGVIRKNWSYTKKIRIALRKDGTDKTEIHKKILFSIIFISLPLAATGSVDGKLNIWDVTTMRLRQTCNHDVCDLLLFKFLLNMTSFPKYRL